MCQGNRILDHMKFIFLLLTLVPTSAIRNEKFDESTVQPMPEASIKCGECPCVNPCTQQQPPPPPPPQITQYCPPQVPPPPRFYYFSGPPELTQITPPPPRFTYVIGGPQDSLYPTDPFNLQIYNRATRDCGVTLGLLLPIIFGLLQILAFLGAYKY